MSSSVIHFINAQPPTKGDNEILRMDGAKGTKGTAESGVPWRPL
jgi:hypothetical protein